MERGATGQHSGATGHEADAVDPEGAIAHDWLLERWVRLAELGVAVGVTLQMGGLLISGTLVGARRYLEGQRSEVLADLSQRGLPPRVARKLDRAFEADLAAIAGSDQAEQDGAGVPYRFIHLKDARIIAGDGGRQGFVVPYWRGQLRRVDAFFLGTLREASD